MKEGSIVAVNYTGKIVASGGVFDTTVEKKAVDAGVFSPEARYAPVIAIVGEGELLKGLDNALKEIKVGEEKTVTLSPSEAYGERNPKLIAVIPLREFKKQKMQPVPGLIVEIDERQGRVQSVSGGRVRVDFNHPLAGKELEYEVKIEREVTEAKDQVNALFEKYFGVIPEKERSIKVKEKIVEIGLDAKYTAALAPIKKRFSDLVTKHVKGIDKIRFVEEFEKEKGKSDKKEAAKEK